MVVMEGQWLLCKSQVAMRFIVVLERQKLLWKVALESQYFAMESHWLLWKVIAKEVNGGY
jgi:hypothetical protein